MGKLKHITFGILLFVIWAPFAQMVLQVINSGGLKGAFVPHVKPRLTDSTWFSGDFQKDYELYLNDTIGFHQDFIRLRNQIDFSLFNLCHSYDVEVGKNGYLVATTHIDAYLGKMHTRETAIDSTVKELQDLTDTLSKLNKTLIVLFAPNRGSFYKELTPYWYDLTKKNESDYECYLRSLSKTNVKVLDFNKWFLDTKETSKYPLYTKCGIHWSLYGANLAGDTLVKYVEWARGIDLPDIHFSKIEYSYKERGVDADIGNAINLIWKIKNDRMAYPILAFNKVNKAKAKLLTIGDSYYYGILDSGIPQETFEEYSFWYYNNSIVSNGPTGGKRVSDMILSEEIERHDVITIIATEVNLNHLGWGFIERAWQLYYGKEDDILRPYIERIKNDSAWFEQVKQKAIKYNKPLETQLREDANYVYDLEKKK
jgi:hypothetical protein